MSWLKKQAQMKNIVLVILLKHIGVEK